MWRGFALWTMDLLPKMNRLSARIFVGLVVLLCLALLASSLTLVVDGGPGREHRNALVCLNNLRKMGELLAAREAAGNLRQPDGAAFLLQVAPDLGDDDLKVFVCPAEQVPDPTRPDEGTPEFVDLFRRALPRDGPDARMCSFAGPDFTRFPDRPGDGPRIWACDRCRGGGPHHKDGLAVLWSTGKVETIPRREIVGGESGRIILGPDSPDPRLRTLFVGD
jgi:hypothetical protein